MNKQIIRKETEMVPEQIQTSSQMLKASEFIVRNKLLPASFKNKEEVFIALQTCLALGFKTFGSMQLAIKNMYLVNGCVEMWGNLPLSLVQRSGLLSSMDEFFVDKDYKRISLDNKNLHEQPIAAVCLVQRKNEKPKEFVVSKQDLILSGGQPTQDGGWVFKRGQGSSPTWKRYPKLHWKYRVRAYALRTVFADVLKNTDIHEWEGQRSGKVDKNGQKAPQKSVIIEAYGKNLTKKEDSKENGKQQKEENNEKTNKSDTDDGKLRPASELSAGPLPGKQQVTPTGSGGQKTFMGD